MGKVTEFLDLVVADLKPYENNARLHDVSQIEKLCKSIEQFGFLSPILVDRNKNIIAGHGRVMAAQQLGLETVPGLYVEGLTEEQRKAYILADNRLAEFGGWDMELVNTELEELQISGFDVELTGFNALGDWFDNRQRHDTSRQKGNEEYNEFLEKFEIKKTTDDCYTPDKVFEAVANYVSDKYKVERSKFVRPFYPGGDYENEKYPEGCIVVDNPPFSILSEILSFYHERKIRFFLFAPTLTLFSSSSSSSSTALPCGVGVTYENGACVNTSFLTNLEDESIRVKTCPELYKLVFDADAEVKAEMKKELPKYSYPDEIITSAMCSKWSKYGIDFEVSKTESRAISALDEQKEKGKGIFGNGYIISERAAAERAAAERAAAERAAAERVERWTLSEREKAIVRELSDA